MADNDPKHTSRAAHQFLEENCVWWWRTPAESPDLNPIEIFGRSLKSTYAGKSTEDLIDGIQAFWSTVSQAKCAKYIRHLRKVIPKVIELEGAATGY